MASTPLEGEVRDLFECAGLLEQVGRPGHNRELHRCLHPPHGRSIQRDHLVILFADDQQGRGRDTGQGVAREIGPPASTSATDRFR